MVGTSLVSIPEPLSEIFIWSVCPICSASRRIAGDSESGHERTASLALFRRFRRVCFNFNVSAMIGGRSDAILDVNSISVSRTEEANDRTRVLRNVTVFV